MAYNNMPIPAPPDSPTPPTPDTANPNTGLGLDNVGFMLSPADDTFDSASLSPYGENFRYGSSSLNAISKQPLNSSTNQPLSPNLPMTPNTPFSPMSPMYQSMSVDSGSQDGKGPFNFQPTQMSKSPVIKSVGYWLLRLLEHKNLTIV